MAGRIPEIAFQKNPYSASKWNGTKTLSWNLWRFTIHLPFSITISHGKTSKNPPEACKIFAKVTRVKPCYRKRWIFVSNKSKSVQGQSAISMGAISLTLPWSFRVVFLDNRFTWHHSIGFKTKTPLHPLQPTNPLLGVARLNFITVSDNAGRSPRALKKPKFRCESAVYRKQFFSCHGVVSLSFSQCSAGIRNRMLYPILQCHDCWCLCQV